jgi:hypothetical protein
VTFEQSCLILDLFAFYYLSPSRHDETWPGLERPLRASGLFMTYSLVFLSDGAFFSGFLVNRITSGISISVSFYRLYWLFSGSYLGIKSSSCLISLLVLEKHRGRPGSWLSGFCGPDTSCLNLTRTFRYIPWYQ